MEIKVLEQNLEKLGSIKDIMNNEYFLYAIIAYHGDSRLLYALFNKVNEGLKNGVLTNEDLEFFRSGKLINAIVNLNETTEIYGNRKPFTSERLEKINYISLIQDEETLSVSYTHPRIIDAICGDTHYDNKYYELIYFIECGIYDKLPKETQKIIVSKVLKKGNIEEARKLSQNLDKNIKTYTRKK